MVKITGFSQYDNQHIYCTVVVVVWEVAFGAAAGACGEVGACGGCCCSDCPEDEDEDEDAWCLIWNSLMWVPFQGQYSVMEDTYACPHSMLLNQITSASPHLNLRMKMG